MIYKITRESARNYTCGDYHIVYSPENKLWNVSFNYMDELTHIDDFPKYSTARDYVLRQANKEIA